MLCKEITAVFIDICTEHILELCGQNLEIFALKLVRHEVATGL